MIVKPRNVPNLFKNRMDPRNRWNQFSGGWSLLRNHFTEI